MNPGVIRKIAVLCKDHRTIREIDDLFLIAGASPGWFSEPTMETGSQRMDHVYGWVGGIDFYAETEVAKILEAVALQLVDDERIPEADRRFLRREFNIAAGPQDEVRSGAPVAFPTSVDQVVERVINGLPRAMRPLKHRRQGLPTLAFDNEYDVQTLLHVLLRPWVRDIRLEEYAPSLAGRSTRMDLLLADHKMVIELKYVRDASHARGVGQELIVDIAHYKKHPHCAQLWGVVYDPHGFIVNPTGLTELEGESTDRLGTVRVRISYLGP